MSSFGLRTWNDERGLPGHNMGSDACGIHESMKFTCSVEVADCEVFLIWDLQRFIISCKFHGFISCIFS